VLTVLPARSGQALFTEVADPVERGEVYKLVTLPGEQPPPLIKKRWLEWQPALTMMSDNFLLGVGTGNYQQHIGEGAYYWYLPNAKKTEPDTNNLYLVIGSSMGFVGLVALLAWLGGFWRMAERSWERARDHWSMGVCWGLLGSVYAIMAVNIFSSLFVRGTSLVWVLLLAMMASVYVRGFEGHDAPMDDAQRSQDESGED
jgi:O-antigen ligase